MVLLEEWADSVVVPLLAASCLWAVLRTVAAAPLRPWRASARLRTGAGPFTSLLGFAATLLTVPPAFSADQAPSPRRSVEPPWSRTSGFPPLRPLVPARAIEPPPEDDRIVDLDGFGAGASYRPLNPSHPGTDGRRHQTNGRGTLLFPTRIQGGSGPSVSADRGDHQQTPGPECRYRVLAGDSLWTIAGRALGTEDPTRIARYWPRIHRANRNLIGATPNLIRPGWVLELPRECD